MGERNLLRAWHDRTKIERFALFGNEADALLPVSQHSEPNVAVPGMVGSRYRTGGLAIISLNPAGGRDNFIPTKGDSELYSAIKAFTACCSEENFAKMNQAYANGMPFWGPQWQHIRAILSASGNHLEDIAYPYLVPFRTRGDRGSALKRNVIDQAYETGFAKVLTLLKPSVVVTVDRHSEYAVSRFSETAGYSFHSIYYTRQRHAHAARTQTLATISQLANTPVPNCR